MITLALSQFLFKLALSVTAVIAMTYTLRYLNSRTGNRFDETLAKAEPNVRLGYFAVRLAAYAFIVGSILS